MRRHTSRLTGIGRIALLGASAALALGTTLAAGTAAQAAPAPVSAASRIANDEPATFVYGGSGLDLNQSWTAGYGETALTLQGNGNVVLTHNGAVVWAPVTNGTGHRLVMQSDGNLVVYNAANWPVWSSGTYNHPGAFLDIMPGGAIAMYYNNTIIWWSNSLPVQPPPCGVGGVLCP
ncbi:hypothetical protein GCM10009665_40910 [Kitasatospora nipponensis]|uniref:Bulb-type lectin domain-containing protein n=1 Tax=Kitasatospora nipponensis TaxID=258049 RepID=A0ABN1WCU8_9ACTN